MATMGRVSWSFICVQGCHTTRRSRAAREAEVRVSGLPFISRELSHMLTPVSVTGGLGLGGRPQERADARRETDRVAEPGRAAGGGRGGPDRRTWHQSAARRIRRSLDRPAVHQFLAGGRAPVFRRSWLVARVLASGRGARRRRDAVCRFRRACLAFG